MKLNSIVLLFIVVYLLLAGCKESTNQLDEVDGDQFDQLIEFAEHLNIQAFSNHYLVQIMNPWMQDDTLEVVLQRKNKQPANFMRAQPNPIVLQVPIQSIALTATTQLAMVQKLNEIDLVKGLSGTKYVYDADIQNRIQDGFIQEIGNPSGGTNIETLIELAPELTLVYGIDENDMPALQKINDSGIKTLMFSEFTETHPLGRAEWIKLIGILAGRESQAMEYFEHIKSEYLRLNDLTKEKSDKQTTFTGMSWKDNWVVPGGQSYVGQFLNDAGSDYLWSDTEEKGSIHLSFESAYEKAIHADVWLNPGMARSIADITSRNELYASFQSINDGTIYNNTKRISENGGYDFWESGAIQPHIILADLIKIFHPDLLPDHELYYYEQLN